MKQTNKYRIFEHVTAKIDLFRQPVFFVQK